MTLKSLIPAIIAVILTIIGNVLFFRYQFKKNKKWKILNQQLTELLLPLFYILKEDGFDISECIMDEN
jgi:predicted permease